MNFQRSRAQGGYDTAYLDLIKPEEEADAIGSTFRISMDYGITSEKEKARIVADMKKAGLELN